MARGRLVAISYAADGELQTVNREVLDEAAQVVFLQDLVPAERTQVLEQAEVLLGWMLGAELRAGELEAAPRLRFIQLLSAGADGVDFSMIPEGAQLAGNVGAYARPIAEHVMAMALGLAKRLPQHHAELARGLFDHQTPSLTLDGAVCGILGFGGIGTATARLLRAFGARIHAVNTSGRSSEPAEFVGTIADLPRVLAAADVLVIAIPLTRATRGLIGRRELAVMKPAAILVNVARADIVDEGALYAHLRENPQFSAGIDTWWHEPSRQRAFRTDYPFFELPNVIGSPHNSGTVPGIAEFAARQAARNVLRYLNRNAPAGVVRREDYPAQP